MYFILIFIIYPLFSTCYCEKDCDHRKGDVLSYDEKGYYYCDNKSDKSYINLPTPECKRFVINGTARYINIISHCSRKSKMFNEELEKECLSDNPRNGPYYTEFGLLFKNKACGMCNNYSNHELVRAAKRDNIRIVVCSNYFYDNCLPGYTLPETVVWSCNNIDTCLQKKVVHEKDKNESMCKSMPSNFIYCPRMDNRLYKNQYCASCNQEDINLCQTENYSFVPDKRSRIELHDFSYVDYSNLIFAFLSLLSEMSLLLLVLTLLAHNKFMKNLLKHFLLIALCICTFGAILGHTVLILTLNNFLSPDSRFCRFLDSCTIFLIDCTYLFAVLYGVDLLLKINAIGSSSLLKIKMKYGILLSIGICYSLIKAISIVIYSGLPYPDEGSFHSFVTYCHYVIDTAIFPIFEVPFFIVLSLNILIFLILGIFLGVKYCLTPSTSKRLRKFMCLYAKMCSVFLPNIITFLLRFSTAFKVVHLIINILNSIRGILIGVVFLSNRHSIKKLKSLWFSIVLKRPVEEEVSHSSNLSHLKSGSIEMNEVSS